MRSSLAVALSNAALTALAGAGCDDPVGPVEPATFAAVSTGGDHTCAIVLGGAAVCWGDGTSSQLGDGAYGSTVVARRVALEDPVVSLDAGYRHTCAIGLEQDLVCWGWNLRGQLGNASTVDQAVPIVVAPFQLRFHQVSAGWFHTCGLTTDADAYCWGDNGQGQLGDGTTTTRLTPVRVTGGLKFSTISAGGSHTCGVSTDAAVYCWGLNHQGQLGTGDVASLSGPGRARSELEFVHVSAGYSHTCALDATGRPWCWGSNARGELGLAATSGPGLPGSETPAQVTDVGAGFIDITAGLEFTCAVLGGGSGFCWGVGDDGQLGNGSFRSWHVRSPVAAGRGLTHISAGSGTHACGITGTGAILCWGRGETGALGVSGTAASARPMRVPAVNGHVAN